MAFLTRLRWAAGDRSRRKNACCVQISRAGHAALHAALSVRRVFGRLPRLHRPARPAKTAAPPPAPRFAPAALCPGRCFALAAALPWPVLCPGRCCLGWHTVRRRFSIPLRVCPACSSERGGSVPRAVDFCAGRARRERVSEDGHRVFQRAALAGGQGDAVGLFFKQAALARS